MFKLLIVDDERVPREGMITLIPWQEYGIEVMSTATDGLDALAKIEKEKPDIVLTDIKMPHMDGIELLKTMHERWPEIDSLIISGYDEFEYAQKAINYGVKGYILKPVDPVELIRLVMQIVEQRINSIANKAQDSNLNNHLRNLIYACYTPEQLEEAAGRFSEINGQWFRVVILQLENIRDAILEQSGSLYTKLNRRLEDFPKECASFHFVERSPNNMTFVFASEDKQTISAVSKAFLEMLMGELNASKYTEFVIGVSGYFSGIENLAAKYLSTLRIINMKYIFGSGRVYYADKKYELATPERNMEAVIRRFVDDAFRGDLDATAKLMNEQYHTFQKDKTCLSDVQTFARNLLHVLIEKANEVDLNIEDIYEDSNSMVFSIYTSNSRKEIMSRLLEFMRTIGNYLQKHRANSPEQICRDVREYIRNHYDNPEMSTSTIAEVFHFNASYLSGLFSNTVHTTVTNDINTVRLEQACILLKATGLKISQIAEKVGFIHSTYFCTVFKRELGMSPTDYRQGQ